MKIARSENCIIVTSTFKRFIYFGCYVTGKLCPRDDKTNCVYISSPSLAIADDPGKRHAKRAHRQEAVSHWLNPHSLGTMSAFGCIENLT